MPASATALRSHHKVTESTDEQPSMSHGRASRMPSQWPSKRGEPAFLSGSDDEHAQLATCINVQDAFRDRARSS